MAKKSSKKGVAKAATASTTVQTQPQPKEVKDSADANQKKLNPLADGDSDAEDQSSDERVTELKVNQKFAKEYTERKQKEELTRLERRRGFLEEADDDDDESDSETEDEDGEELTAELDADIMKTLRLIRKKDPIIYDHSVAFFKPKEGEEDDSEASDDEEDKTSKGKKQKKDAPLYYKDLVRQQVITGDIESDDEEDKKPRVMTYGEEQQQLKQDFLKSLKKAESDAESDDGEEGDDLEGGLFSVRKKTDVEQQQENEEYAAFQSKYGSKLKKDEIDPDAFLEHYLSSGGWKEKKDLIPHYEDIVREDEEDAEELEKMEEFEHSYNFRFEEEGAGLIQTYSRNIEDSMRRKDDSRKRKREERKERKALERLKKEEELKRLKNLKQADIQKKLEKIATLMGKSGATEEERLKALSADLEGDFDPEDYDKRMQQIFDEEYYNEDDEEMTEKPTWDDEEDKALFADLPVEDEDEEDAEEEMVNNVVEREEEEEEEDEQMEDEEEEDEAEENDESWKNMTPEELQRAKQKYLDELYGLDYEDLIGDIKCRFKYREVKKNDFGLTVDEIMVAEDKELKALVSLKRLAPYQEEEFTINRRKVKQFQRSLQERKEEEAANKKRKKAKGASEEHEDEEQPEAVAESNGKKKRKRAKKNKSEAEAQPEQENPEDEAEDKDEAKPKKKSRRGKKSKSKDSNAFASTGLSSSRLESYKLLKPKAKK